MYVMTQPCKKNTVQYSTVQHCVGTGMMAYLVDALVGERNDSRFAVGPLAQQVADSPAHLETGSRRGS